jgi:DNA mismatch repair protein MutS
MTSKTQRMINQVYEKNSRVYGQYARVKQDYPGALPFIKTGDFFETFDEDAKVVARELDVITITFPVGNGRTVQMAGFPAAAVDQMVGILVEAGYQVAVAYEVARNQGGEQS